MKYILSILILLFFSNSVEGSRLYSENIYNKFWCSQTKGEYEKTIPDKIGNGYTRADCILDKYAIEADFADKWKECAGQAFYYADMLGKIPACLLIMENYEKELKYFNRLNLLERRGLKIFIITPNDLK